MLVKYVMLLVYPKEGKHRVLSRSIPLPRIDIPRP